MSTSHLINAIPKCVVENVCIRITQSLNNILMTCAMGVEKRDHIKHIIIGYFLSLFEQFYHVSIFVAGFYWTIFIVQQLRSPPNPIRRFFASIHIPMVPLS